MYTIKAKLKNGKKVKITTKGAKKCYRVIHERKDIVFANVFRDNLLVACFLYRSRKEGKCLAS